MFTQDINDISSMEDPINGADLDVAEYIEIYKLVLEELDGKDKNSYMDIYFIQYYLLY